MINDQGRRRECNLEFERLINTLCCIRLMIDLRSLSLYGLFASIIKSKVRESLPPFVHTLGFFSHAHGCTYFIKETQVCLFPVIIKVARQ